MKHLKVKLWGQEIGRLAWDSTTRRIYFTHNPDLSNIPDIAPLQSPLKNRNNILPLYGDERPIYQGLPPFIADSLPDAWGNMLFDKWVKDNKIPRNKVTPLYKLMFIGTRGMGALEYEPYAEDLTHTRKIDIKSLYDISLRILEDRDNIVLNINDELTLQSLLAVGTSAGGRQMKAIIAINEATGEIRSGQTDDLEGFDYYILKFGDKSIPIAEIETAYYRMAVDAGIEMEKCQLLPIDGTNHFLTKRFDRRNGKKIHMQTLAAMNPEARSYEDLIATCRELFLSESEIEQLFGRMVFNVMTNNTDDHNKNFAFLLEEYGQWRLAPAYDITFIFNIYGTGPNTDRRLSIGGKTSDITKADLLEFAKLNGIKNVNAMIGRVADVIKDFDRYATESGIVQPWRSIIHNTLNENLTKFGYPDKDNYDGTSFTDRFGRCFDNLSFSVNSKGYIEVSVFINGKRHKKFIRPNMEIYPDLMKQNLSNLPPEYKIRLIETLFTIE
ncbi:MAG: type II toxin-antitoxin system HipA family toxin [Muribaculaceae bacterium]|nr:type II toxin-antitoxin system HipA family toxin [Muribaculaceae bacterium]